MSQNTNTPEFLKHILDSMDEHIVVVDEQGYIQYVNRSWLQFGSNNQCAVKSNWHQQNYLEECHRAAKRGDEFALNASKGITSVIERKQTSYYFEYPCHSPSEERWFMMRVNLFTAANKDYIVISHQNITERRIAENTVRALASTDPLTNIPNRRTFNEFYHEEWRRSVRHASSMCLAIVDLDDFKQINDQLGHLAGDECLVAVGKILLEFSNRPGDICARYGGDEFIIAWGDTEIVHAKAMANKLAKKISQITLAKSSTDHCLNASVSIGLAEIQPSTYNQENDLIKLADQALYKAKDNGRDRIEDASTL